MSVHGCPKESVVTLAVITTVMASVGVVIYLLHLLRRPLTTPRAGPHATGTHHNTRLLNVHLPRVDPLRSRQAPLPSVRKIAPPRVVPTLATGVMVPGANVNVIVSVSVVGSMLRHPPLLHSGGRSARMSDAALPLWGQGYGRFS